MNIKDLSIQIADPAKDAINNFMEHLKFHGEKLSRLDQELISDLHNLKNDKDLGKILLIIMKHPGECICNLFSCDELEYQIPVFIPFLFYCDLIESLPNQFCYKITKLGINVLKQNNLIEI